MASTRKGTKVWGAEHPSFWKETDGLLVFFYVLLGLSLRNTGNVDMGGWLLLCYPFSFSMERWEKRGSKHGVDV